MILYVRGDLRSETGWARATRALVAAVQESFDSICGADLHYHPSRSTSVFPHPVVEDAPTRTVLALLQDVVVLHACQPDFIYRVPGALNVGWWFWETDQISTDLDWMERLEALDILFVPSMWQAEWVARFGLRTPVEILPWPHDVPAPSSMLDHAADAVLTHRPLSLHQLDSLARANAAVDLGARAELLAAQAEDFPIGSQAGRRYFFAVQSDAPRKGLACLLSEWRDYRHSGGKVPSLLIRFSGLNANDDPCLLLQRFSQIGLAAMRGDEARLAEVQVIVAPMPEAALQAAYAGAVSMISASLGEGFGGTLVEAMTAGTLPITPCHTACGQLLPDDYPLAYESLPHVGALMGQLPIQPANGIWHLPKPGAIAAALHRRDAMTAAEHEATLMALSTHMRSTLSPQLVSARFAAAIAGQRTMRDAALAPRGRKGAMAPA